MKLDETWFIHFVISYHFYTNHVCYNEIHVLTQFRYWAGIAQSVQPLATAGRSGNRVPVGARFSPPIQTGPRAHPAPYTSTGSLSPGLSGRRVALTTHPHLAPRLKKEQSCTSSLPLGLHNLFTFTFI